LGVYADREGPLGPKRAAFGCLALSNSPGETLRLREGADPTAVFVTALSVLSRAARALPPLANRELYHEAEKSLSLLLRRTLPPSILPLVASLQKELSPSAPRAPFGRASPAKSLMPSLAPKVQKFFNPTAKKSSDVQNTIDKVRRDYKRERKTIMRELKLDAVHVADENYKSEAGKNAKKKEERHKNYSWLEGEQATMNRQVRLGGGLMKGGGAGQAKKDARNAGFKKKNRSQR